MTHGVSALAWKIVGDTMTATVTVTSEEGSSFYINVERWTAGDEWPEEESACRYVAALGMWMSTFAEVDEAVAPRSVRRSLKRGTGAEPPVIARVKLRKIEPEDGDNESSDDSESSYTHLSLIHISEPTRPY